MIILIPIHIAINLNYFIINIIVILGLVLFILDIAVLLNTSFYKNGL